MELPFDLPLEASEAGALALAFAAAFLVVLTLFGIAWPRISAAIAERAEHYDEILKDMFEREVSGLALARLRWFGPPVAAVAVQLLSGRPVFALAAAVLAWFAPDFWLWRRRYKRRERLETQVTEVIGAIATTTRAGLTLRESLQDAADKLPAPAGDEVGLTCRRLEAGQSLDAALRATDERLSLPGYTLLIRALIVNRERGGHLAALLVRAAETLRELAKLDEKIKAQTSGIRLAAQIMVFMPLVLGILLYMMDPPTISLLFDTLIGNAIVVVILIMDLTGFFMLWKLANPDI